MGRNDAARLYFSLPERVQLGWLDGRSVVRVTTGSFALTQLNEPKTLDSFDGVLGIAFSAYILSYITLGSDQILALHKLHHAVPPEYDYTQLVWTSSEISSWTDGVWELRHAGQGRVDLHVSAGTPSLLASATL
ncbi:hypothetical protein TeGR_g15002 [Tetraparma gracilis]|nr:hypothetical protein TeGR_g15002 [Tetraparma gracilis]